jgi:hypothetical protein
LLGSFGIEKDNRVSKNHTRFLVDKKQNITFSFNPVSMTCYNCAGGGDTGFAMKGRVGAVRSSFFLIKTFLQLFLAPLESVLRASELRMDHCWNSYSGWILPMENTGEPSLAEGGRRGFKVIVGSKSDY